MTDLASLRCEPCATGTPPLTPEEISVRLGQVPGWSLEGGKLTRNLTVKNFRAALEFMNEVGELAEREGHHPDLTIHSWNKILIVLYTHSIGGLSENDFILAAKIEKLLEST